MSLRLRITLLAAAAVAAAIIVASIIVYVTDRTELIGQVDANLRATRTVILKPFAPRQPLPRGLHLPRPQIPLGQRHIDLGGSLTTIDVQPAPAGRRRHEIQSPRISTDTVHGTPTRVITFVSGNRRIILSRPLTAVDSNLANLRWLLLLTSLGGIGVAAILGLLVGKTAIAPLRKLTEATERIVETRDLTRRIGRTGRTGRDEIARLASRLDELLDTLDASLRTQRQFVADASHELRTPIATLRANVEVLASSTPLTEGERAELISDIHDELQGMTTLVTELVELARGEEADIPGQAFRLDHVVEAAIERAARRTPNLAFRTDLHASTVIGDPDRIDRAVTNLLDNARKWTTPDEPLDVSVRDGLIEVRDHGPGIAEHDLPLVFNRFYRSAVARSTPGAGLGLAIVKQIAEAHGGTITVENARDGGAIARLQLVEQPPQIDGISQPGSLPSRRPQSSQ
jgi:two-component system sensor histidine kinase MprB